MTQSHRSSRDSTRFVANGIPTSSFPVGDGPCTADGTLPSVQQKRQRCAPSLTFAPRGWRVRGCALEGRGQGGAWHSASSVGVVVGLGLQRGGATVGAPANGGRKKVLQYQEPRRVLRWLSPAVAGDVATVAADISSQLP